MAGAFGLAVIRLTGGRVGVSGNPQAEMINPISMMSVRRFFIEEVSVFYRRIDRALRLLPVNEKISRKVPHGRS